MMVKLALAFSAPFLLSACSPQASGNEAITAASEQCVAGEPLPGIPADAPPNSTYLAAGKPIPERYRAPPAGWVKIKFMSAAEVNRVCAGGTAVCGTLFYACVRDRELIMPNPCDEPGAPADMGFAGTLCHELAHVNGWPETHGD